MGAKARHTAFVLSGGASLGALQVGMLRALYERGITADLLVGTSVGALNAAFIASRPQTPATTTELAGVWSGVKRGDAFPLGFRGLAGGLLGQRDHLVSARGLRKILHRHVQLDDLSDAAIPLHLTAFDITAGKEVILSQGPAVEAIVATCSIPGIFPAVPVGDKLLIDGGVVNNTPIRHAVELGADRIYVLPTQALSYAETAPPRTAADAAIYGLGVLVGNQLEADLARYRSDVELILLPASNSQRIQPTDFEHSSELTAAAHATARQVLARASAPRPAQELAAAA
jgi:NTE family protein